MNETLIQTAEMSPDLKALLRELKDYCDAERGRRAAVSREIGVTMPGLWNILNAGQEPTGSQTLKILRILGKLK